jgi:7-cyano-7-deazaguanine synthase
MNIVTVLSGGMDSTALLYYLLKEKHEVAAITFDYDQRHYCEVQYAQRTCNELGVKHFIFDLRNYHGVARSALTHAAPVPHGHYAADNMRTTVVPNRNMTMLSIAAAWAISSGADAIATGVHAGDHAVYPDCRPEFIVHMETTLKIANQGFIDPDFRIIAPWSGMSKAEIVSTAQDLELNVPWASTWSCYEGNGVNHCGQCGTCVERKEAFEIAGVDDPTAYQA